MDAAMPHDLQAKYQKLASEYAKMRAQVSVLKKAVLDEQSKNFDNQAVMKEKDQCNRKYEQEMESITFRNQQLTKRILVLQEETEELARANKKGKGKAHDTSNSSMAHGGNVITEELQSKIEENAKLHKQVHELELEYEQKIQDLQIKVEKFERDASSYEGQLSHVEEKNKSLIEKLTKDKARLELKLQSEEKTLRQATMQSEIYQENLASIQGDLSDKLLTTSKILHDKLLFNDTKTRELNSLNIPTIDCKQQRAVKKLIHVISDSFKDFVAALSNFHTYNEQRINNFYQDQQLSPVNKKLVEYLHRNASKLRPLREAFEAFESSLDNNVIISLETIKEFQAFYEKFSTYIAYWNILLPYHLLSIQEECALSSCSPSLEAKNMDLHGSLLKLSRLLNKVQTYLEFIAIQSQGNRKCRYPESSQTHCLHLLLSSLVSLHSTLKDVWKHFNGKLALEHQLPTISDELKRTNECVLSSLISLVNCVGKISNLLDENITIITSGIIYKSRGSSVSLPFSDEGLCTSPAVLDFQRRAINYLSILDEEEPESVPYEEALRNKEILNSSSESREGLAKQLETMQEKVHKLDQAKEHWMLEFQLLEIKHERDLKRLNELEKQGKQSTPISDEEKVKVRPHRNSSSAQPLSTLGNVDQVAHDEWDSEAREEEMKRYFTSRINQLVADMQLADSRAVTFQTECSSLQKKLFLSEKSSVQLQENLADAQDQIAKLKEELQLTTKNYEGQLNTMSEHLANLNDTLTAQKDEIDGLKYSLKQKVQKKGKLK